MSWCGENQWQDDNGVCLEMCGDHKCGYDEKCNENTGHCVYDCVVECDPDHYCDFHAANCEPCSDMCHPTLIDVYPDCYNNCPEYFHRVKSQTTPSLTTDFTLRTTTQRIATEQSMHILPIVLFITFAVILVIIVVVVFYYWKWSQHQGHKPHCCHIMTCTEARRIMMHTEACHERDSHYSINSTSIDIPSVPARDDSQAECDTQGHALLLEHDTEDTDRRISHLPEAPTTLPVHHLSSSDLTRPNTSGSRDEDNRHRQAQPRIPSLNSSASNVGSRMENFTSSNKPSEPIDDSHYQAQARRPSRTSSEISLGSIMEKLDKPFNLYDYFPPSNNPQPIDPPPATPPNQLRLLQPAQRTFSDVDLRADDELPSGNVSIPPWSDDAVYGRQNYLYPDTAAAKDAEKWDDIKRRVMPLINELPYVVFYAFNIQGITVAVRPEEVTVGDAHRALLEMGIPEEKLKVQAFHMNTTSSDSGNMDA